MKCHKDACKPNKRLIPVKGTYFFLLAAVNSVFPFLAIHMKQLGLSASETSIILGVTTFIGAITRTAIGSLADKLRKHKEMLIACNLATAVIHCFLLLVPAVHKMEPSKPIPLYCGSGGSYVELCRINESTYNDCSWVNMSQVKQEWVTIFNTSQQDIMFNKSDCSLSCVISDGQRYNINIFNENNATISQQDSVFLKRSIGNEGANVHISVNVNTNTPLWDRSTTNDTVCHQYVVYSVDIVGKRRDVRMKCNKPIVFLCTAEGDLPASIHFNRCLKNTSSEEAVPFGRTFWLYMVIYFFAQILFSPVFSLIDAIAYDYLGEERGKWGRQRMWGTLGTVTFSVTSGYLMDLFSRGKDETDYRPAFILFACLEVLCVVMTVQYRGSKNVLCTVPPFKDMGALLKRPDALVLFFVVFVAGMYLGLIENYLFWHLQTLGHTPKLLFGLCMLFNGVPEIVILFIAGSIIKKLGHVNCLCLACAAFAARMIAYSFLRDPWMALYIEPLQGFTYGLFYATASAYGSLITPQGLHGTMQGIIGSLHFGFGRGIGSLEGGQLIDLYGTANTYRMHGISACVLVVLYFLTQKLWINRTSTQTDPKIPDEDNIHNGLPAEEKNLSPK